MGGEPSSVVANEGSIPQAECVAGVTEVVNEIKVRSHSLHEDRIRRAVYRQPRLRRYAIQPVPPIHTVTRKGVLTLEGILRSRTEKEIAALCADGVPSVFAVS